MRKTFCDICRVETDDMSVEAESSNWTVHYDLCAECGRKMLAWVELMQKENRERPKA